MGGYVNASKRVSFSGTVLGMGSVDDGDLLQRDGANIVGVAGASKIIENGGTTLTFGNVDDTGILWRNGASVMGGVANWSIGETPTAGPRIVTTTPATSGSDQNAPMLVLGSRNWVGSADTSQEIGLQAGYQAGYLNALHIMHRPDGGSWATRAVFSMPASGGGTLSGLALIFGTSVYGSTQVYVGGDVGSGSASQTKLTNATAAKDSTRATLGNTPTGIVAENAAWMKIYIGTATAYIPYWTA